MGTQDETWVPYTIQCSKMMCSASRIVEFHHPVLPYKGYPTFPPWGLHMNILGWEFRITKEIIVGGSERVYVEFVCPECVVEEQKGKE